METENNDLELETASVTQAGGMHLVGAIDSFRMDLDAEEHAGGAGTGPQPHRLLLLALVGCMSMDVISVLRKKRKPGQRPQRRSLWEAGGTVEHPKVYTQVEVFYRVPGNNIDPRSVERSIELSKTRYCPVIARLAQRSRSDHARRY